MNNASSKSSSFIIINYLLLFGCGLIWGSQYFLNKIALESFSTSMIAAGRIGIGALTLMLILLLGGETSKPLNPKRSFWQCLPDFILIGLLEATIPTLLVAWAQHQLPSSVTAILIGTVPLFATIMEGLFVKGHTISAIKIIGIILGFFGVVVLAGKDLLDSHLTSFASSSLPLLPIVAVLGAAFCFSMTMLLIKIRLSPNLGPIHAAQGILLGASLTALPLMIVVTKPWTLTSFHPVSSASLALALLGIFCGGIVYILYVRLINRAGPSFASTCNYLVPPIGAFIGIVFSGEKMTSNVIAALVLILVALWFSRGTSK
ncbi:MAG: DMT family transporter [Chthoniobacterales bacterium]